jgi:hypothetical protein
MYVVYVRTTAVDGMAVVLEKRFWEVMGTMRRSLVW